MKVIKDLNQKLLFQKNQVYIHVVSNIRDIAVINNEFHSEYLSQLSLEKILCTYRDLGFEAVSYSDELDFIYNYSSNKSDNKTNIVINYAQSGTQVGRKSLIPSFCDRVGIIYCGSNPYVVSLTRHKYHSDILSKYIGANLTNSYYYSYEYGWFNNFSPKKGEKIIVKLNYEASSIGLTSNSVFEYSKSKDEFIFNISKKFNQPVLVQEFIEGIEIECPYIKGNIDISFEPIEIKINNNSMNSRFLTNDIRLNEKYGFSHSTKLDAITLGFLNKANKSIVQLFDLEGFCRIDYRIDSNHNCYLTDIATNPGISEHTSFYTAFKSINMDYADMLLYKIANILDYKGNSLHGYL